MKQLIYGLLITAVALTTFGCMHSTATNPIPGAFKYREIYLPHTDYKDNDELGLNTVDDDWGIWGHNLANVLPEKPSTSVYSQHDGSTDHHQFCFTSEKLYGYIKDYINNNYSRSDSINFAIVPNDNDIVCLCAQCVRVGNTEDDATPAVMKMVKKLCEEFPNHTFFTSHYATTSTVPRAKMPKNSGVLVSAITYPLIARSTPQEEKFKDLLQQWRKVTDNVYIWDYINNFDDYFTPFPIFNVAQHRLKMYKEAGVDGVFFNGSGHDYSTFSDLHKIVLSKMMIDPEIDWKAELIKTAKAMYPHAGEDIANYIIDQEEFALSTGKTLPMYEGVEKSLNSHLQADKTRELYANIQKHLTTAKGREKQNLEDLESALALTMLELNRIEKKLDGSEALLKKLERFPRKDIEYYNEAYWPIVNYIGNYESMLSNAKETAETNLLKGAQLRPLNKLDEEYNDISILTDGQLGISSNYHNGIMISSADPSLSIMVPKRPGMESIKIYNVYNPAYKIGLPTAIVMSVGGRTYEATPKRPNKDTGHAVTEFNVPKVGGDIKLTFIKDPEVKTFAIDEIQGFGHPKSVVH